MMKTPTITKKNIEQSPIILRQRFISRCWLLALISLMSLGYSIVACFLVNVPLLPLLIANTLTFMLLVKNLELLKNRRYSKFYVAFIILELVMLIFSSKYKISFLAGIDWENFHSYALNSIKSSHSISQLYSNSTDLFVFIVAILYKIFGTYSNMIYFYIFPTSLLLFRYVYKTVHYLTGNHTRAVWAAMLTVTWPVNMLFAVSYLRTLPLELLVTISFYGMIKYLKLNQFRYLLLAIIFSILAALTHSGLIVLLAVYPYVIVQNKFYKKFMLVRLLPLVLAGVLITCLSLTPLWINMSKRFSGVDSTNSILTSLENQNEYLVANSGYIASTPQHTIGLIISAPYRVLMFAGAPFPWQIYNIPTLLSLLLNGLPQVIIAIISYKIIIHSKRLKDFDRNALILSMLIIFCTYLVFAFGTNNYGTAIRHRTVFLPILLIIIFSFYKYNPNTFRKIEI